jgi:peptide/nickel transport system substrate-binding protein
MKHVTKFVVVTALVGLVAASCGGGGGSSSNNGGSTGEKPKKGGTLNIAQLGDVTAAFDPQKEYYQVSFLYYQCCLLRTLLSYNGLDSAHNGNDLQPDLATGMPEVSSDGLTWTFHMKSGIHYAPPMQDVEITAPDIIRALEREFTPEVAAGYGFYYNNIEGSADFSSGKAKTVSGLSAPDPHTLVVKLTEPAGDLGFRFALPATAPIPPSPSDPSAVLGVATGHDDDYGRFLVASGPYMFKGSEALDFSQPAKDQTPVAGYVPNKSYDIVRNPSWDSSSDSLRPAYVDEIQAQLGGENAVLDQKVEANEQDLVLDSSAPDPQFLQKFKTTPDLQNRIHIDQTQGNYYATMNLGVAPFDDIHVRKAVNLAVDKDGARRIGGGPDIGEIAGHFLPDSLLNDQLKSYNPYATPGNKGADDPAGLEAAKAEMKQATQYDTNGDGVCDVDACKNVLTVSNNQPKQKEAALLMQQNLEAIGITLNIKYFTQSAAYGKVFDPKNHIAFTTGWAGWLKDYPDAFTFFYPVMYGPNILDQYNTNYSMVGATPEQMTKYGYSIKDVAGMDDQIKKCFPLTGDERISCWSDADKYLMETVVPIIPMLFSNSVYITSDRIVNYTYSAYNDAPSLSQLGVTDATGS